MLAAPTPTNPPQDRPQAEPAPARARGWGASGWRPVVQVFFLLLFLYLTLSLGRPGAGGLPHDLFL